MNATDRFIAVLLSRFDSAPLRDDYRRHGNGWARVQRDLACTATSYYGNRLRSVPLPSRNNGNWNRKVGSRCMMAYEQPKHPVKPVVRFLRLQRMLDTQKPGPLKKFFRLCRARQVAFGWDIFLTQARRELRTPAALTERQQRIRQLASTLTNGTSTTILKHDKESDRNAMSVGLRQ
jgi:hypothetical protein